jgi:hypothetical protein
LRLIVERQAILLYDRMVAYHVMNGLAIPIDAADFYKGLDERFLKRDGMYFLSDQVNEYDTARIVNDVEPVQFVRFLLPMRSLPLPGFTSNLRHPRLMPNSSPNLCRR